MTFDHPLLMVLHISGERAIAPIHPFISSALTFGQGYKVNCSWNLSRHSMKLPGGEDVKFFNSMGNGPNGSKPGVCDIRLAGVAEAIVRAAPA